MKILLTSFVVLLLVSTAAITYIYGKKVGYKEGLLGAANICKYLNDSEVPKVTTPTERSLKAAAWAYTSSTKESINKIIKERPDFGTTPQSITRNMALWFDESPESLALVEADMKKAGN